MEIIVDFLNLDQIFILHFSSGCALFAGGVGVWEQNLVNNDVSDVDLLLGQLNAKPFRFIHAQKFWNADRYKRRLISILKLFIDLFYLLFHVVEGLEDFLL